MNQDKYNLQMTTAIYGDKVAFLSYAPNDMSGIIIQNERINSDFRQYYKMLREHLIMTNPQNGQLQVTTPKE